MVINNLGGLSNLELGALTDEVQKQLGTFPSLPLPLLLPFFFLSFFLFFFFSFFVPHCPLSTANYALPTTRYPLPSIHYQLFTANYSLSATNYPLLTIYCRLFTVYYPLFASQKSHH
jgi:hypothetical protein